MAEFGRLKEEVGHLKLWESVAVVIVSGLGGWLASAADTAAPFSFGLALGGVILARIGILVMYRQVSRRIDRIGEL